MPNITRHIQKTNEEHLNITKHTIFQTDDALRMMLLGKKMRFPTYPERLRVFIHWLTRATDWIEENN